MILVLLGTQDKHFKRLLEKIDEEIEKGFIKEKVIVQAGSTQYTSKNMDIFDLVSPEKLEKFMKESRLIITHGGVGSILSAIRMNKPVIAVARLKKYHEHTNDHQKQIVHEFASRGYILELSDFSKFEQIYKKAETFKPKDFKSNTKNMVSLIDSYIKKDNHISWYNKFCKIFWIFIFIILIGIIYLIVKL